MRCHVVFNPWARGREAREFPKAFRAAASETGLSLTSAPGTARGLAYEAVTQGCDCVVAAGGDGTVNEVINGIADHEEGLRRVRLGVIPLGTMNVFAKDVGVPLRWRKAWEVIQAGNETRLNLPMGDFHREGARESRYFVQLAGAGLDGRAIELVDWPLKQRFGPLAYILASFRALGLPLEAIKVKGDGFTSSGTLVVVGNGRYYGGRFRVFPKADPRDGLLDVCVIPGITPWRLFWMGMLLIAGYWPPKGVEYFQTTGLDLKGASTVPLEMEGDLVGYLPARIRMTPSLLRVLVPSY